MTVQDQVRSDEAASDAMPAGQGMFARLRDNAHWYLFIAPAVILLIAFMGFPLYRSLELSLFQWKGLLPRKWAGVENFHQLLGDPYFWNALSHTLIFAVA